MAQAVIASFDFDVIRERMVGELGAAFQSFVAGVDTFAVHVGVTLLMLIIATTVFGILTPHRELKLIRAGNPAAGVSFGGTVIGFALPLAVCMATSINWADIVVWGTATLLVQMFAFRFTDLLLHHLPRRIADGETAAAALLASVKLAVAIVLAAAVAGLPLAKF